MPSRAFTLATVLGTDGNLNAQDVSGLAAVASTGSFSDVINKPTTTSGYGITDSSPTITSLVYAGNDLATDTTTPLAVTIIGTNFEASSNIYIDTISAANACTSLQYSGTTQITFTPPAKSAASYNVWLVGPSGKIAVLANGILYSGTPSWAGVATSYTTETNVVSIQLTAASTDTPVTYSLVSGTLPSGVTLSSTGLISGTAAITATTTYSNLVIRATDQQNQDANLTVSLTVTYIKPVTRSLRFNSADGTSLDRTPGSATNRQTFTISFWAKNPSTTGSITTFYAAGSDTNNNETIIGYWDGLYVQSTLSGATWRIRTSAVYRDPSAWYHFIFAFDLGNGTQANRLKIYVNGVDTSYSAADGSPLPSTANSMVNSNVIQYIGRRAYSATGQTTNACLTEFYLIDGQALTPSSFGETNPQTGVWRPISYTGSYGTNGFYLDFSDNSAATASTLGKDYSGNNNNWTPNNFSVASGAGNDSLVDSPTPYGTDTGVGGEVRGNYCTLNPLSVRRSFAISNGGLSAVNNGFNDGASVGTIALPTTGKWYWEVRQGPLNGGVYLLYTGLLSKENFPNDSIPNAPGAMIYPRNTALCFYNNSGTANCISENCVEGDVYGVAYNADTGVVDFYKNGVLYSGQSVTVTTGVTYYPFLAIGNQGPTASINFGQQPFAYPAPSGYKTLCTQNLPTPTIGATTATQAGKYFNTVLWTGDGADNRSITGVGFQPDFVWVKARNAAEWNNVYDAVRGANKAIYTNSVLAEETATETFQSFDVDGFTVSYNSAYSNVFTNKSSSTYVAWNWKANGSGSSNTAGSITSTVSANTTSGFSIVTYTTTGSVVTVGHGLGVAPSMIIVKARGTTSDWYTYHVSLGATKGFYLNQTAAEITSANFWNNTAPTSTVFTNGTGVVTSGNTAVAYCFAAIPGYSAFGSYTGNGSSNGPFVYTGFKPAYVMYKGSSTSGGSWNIRDDARSPSNVAVQTLFADTSGAEGGIEIDILSNGFKIRDTSANVNSSGVTYIYAAFAETPFKYSLAR